MMPLKKHTLLLLSALSGVLLGLSFATKFAFPLLCIAMVPLLWVESGIRSTSFSGNKTLSFSYFYLAFIFFNLFAAWWSYKSSWAGFFAVVLLNSLYMATAFWLFHFSKKYLPAYLHLVSLISIWITAEYIHFHWELSWPWLTLGAGIGNHIRLIQWYEFTGVLGGSIWILVINYLVFRLIKIDAFTNKSRTILALILIVFIPASISLYQFSKNANHLQARKVLIVQPNFASYTQKYTIPAQVQINRIFHLADSLLDSSIHYLIIPETAIPCLTNQDRLLEDEKLTKFVELSKKYPDLSIILGLSTYKKVPCNPKDVYAKYHNKIGHYYAYNTALFFDKAQKIQMHHKTKLVLGVEKMPFGKVFRFLEAFTIDLGGVVGSIMPDTSTIAFNDDKNTTAIIPLICFESAYGGYARKFLDTEQGFIAIITNDDWWGNTAGYKQHFMHARIRAIEMRRSVARSANTGLSALINKKGEILTKTKWKETTALTGSIYLNHKLTFYAKHGDYPGAISTIIACCIFCWITIQLILAKLVKKRKF